MANSLRATRVGISRRTQRMQVRSCGQQQHCIHQAIQQHVSVRLNTTFSRVSQLLIGIISQVKLHRPNRPKRKACHVCMLLHVIVILIVFDMVINYVTAKKCACETWF